MTEFLAILAVVVGLTIVAYIKIPKFKVYVDDAFLGKFMKRFNSASEASEVEVGTPVSPAPYKSTGEAVKPLAVDFYDGQGDPPSQEAWAAWRARQPKSSQAYIPKVWFPADKPEPEDPNFNMPKPFPIHWDYSKKRVPVHLKAGVTYSMSFAHDGNKHQVIGTANVNIPKATPTIAFRNSKGVFPVPTRSQEFNVKFGPGTKYETTEGINHLEFTVANDGGFTLLLMK